MAWPAAGGAVEVGDLKQLPDPDGCWAETTVGPEVAGCSDGFALNFPRALTVSPDGKSVYVTSEFDDAIAIFDRAFPGTLTQKLGTQGCISDTGSGGLCASGTALEDPRGIAVSPDDRSVYVASGASDAIAVFDRNLTTGALTQKAGTAGCISNTGSGGSCTLGQALDRPVALTVSPDGKNVYVASSVSKAIAVLDRNTTTGALSQDPGAAGCVSHAGIGGCTLGKALDGVNDVVVSGGGGSLYSTASVSDAVAVFDRGAASGHLTQKAGTAGCISETGSGGDCTDGVGLDGPSGAAISDEDAHLYVSSQDSERVALFDRAGAGGLSLHLFPQKSGTALGTAADVVAAPDGHSVYAANLDSAIVNFDREARASEFDFGKLDQKPGLRACVSTDGSSTTPDHTPGACADGSALFGVGALAISPDAQNLYSTAEFDNAIAVFRRNDGVPAATTITFAPEERTSETTATFEFAADEPGVKFECHFGKDLFPPRTPCSSPVTYEAPASKQRYWFSVRAIDFDANPEPGPPSYAWRVDTKVKGKLKADKKQKPGKRVTISGLFKVKEPVLVAGTCRCSTPVDVRTTLTTGGGAQTGTFSGTAQIAGCEFGFSNCPARPETAAAAGPGATAAAKCKDVTDPCVIGKKVLIEIRPKSRKKAKKLDKKLDKGKTPKFKTVLEFTDQAGNSKRQKIKVKLKP